MNHLTLILGLFFLLIIPNGNAQETNWGVDFSDAIMARHPNTINDLTGKGWEYSNSIVLYGMIKIHEYTQNPAYVDYVKKYVDDYVDANGNINFKSSDNNLDHLHPGLLLLFLYEQTGQEKYKKAAGNIRLEFDKQPRNPSGGYWHKQRYPNQMWADGIYMAQPFLMEYGAMFNDLEYAANEATKQTTLLADHAYDASNHLIYHGWDETKAASWADGNGRSPEVWSRGMGWYCMALVDMLDVLPKEHAEYNALVKIVQDLAVGIKQTQDASTGLWFQVVDKGNLSSNWIEISGSAMFVYMLKKGVDKGYLDISYKDVITSGWEGIQNNITLDSRKRPGINNFVLGMGIKDNYATYISQSRVSTPSSKYPHGYCAILSLSSVMEWPKEKVFELSIETIGDGMASSNTSETMFMPGSFVKLTANPNDGASFLGWTGAITSNAKEVYLKMDAGKSVTANFTAQVSVQDVEGKKSKKIYPNPVKDMLYIQNVTKGISYHIYHLNGVLLKTGFFNPDVHSSISVSDLSSGTYLLKMGKEFTYLMKE